MNENGLIQNGINLRIEIDLSPLRDPFGLGAQVNRFHNPVQ